jgi:hypothetical protein
MMRLAETISRVAPGATEIRLAPEELGRIRLRVTGAEGVAHIVIAADRPETLDLIRRHLPELMQDLRQQGFDQATFAFGRDPGAAGKGADHAPPADTGSGPDAIARPRSDHQTDARPRGTGTLDMRL